MKQDIAETWASALESDEYKQGKGALCENGQFCCLGVLCDLAVKADIGITVKDGGFIHAISYDGKLGYLPPSVMAWAGMRTDHGAFKDWETNGSLANFNDAGMTFSEIAGKIREGWERL